MQSTTLLMYSIEHRIDKNCIAMHTWPQLSSSRLSLLAFISSSLSPSLYLAFSLSNSSEFTFLLFMHPFLFSFFFSSLSLNSPSLLLLLSPGPSVSFNSPFLVSFSSCPCDVNVLRLDYCKKCLQKRTTAWKLSTWTIILPPEKCCVASPTDEEESVKHPHSTFPSPSSLSLPVRLSLLLRCILSSDPLSCSR